MSSKPNTSKGCIWGIISLLITPFVLFYSGQLIIEEQDRQITSSTVISLTISMVALIFSLVKCKIFKPLATTSGSGDIGGSGGHSGCGGGGGCGGCGGGE